MARGTPDAPANWGIIVCGTYEWIDSTLILEHDTNQWSGGTSGSNRVKRGGSFDNNDDNLRVSNRNDDNPSNDNDNLGFRCASSRHSQTGSLHGCYLRARRDQRLPPRASLPRARPPLGDQVHQRNLDEEQPPRGAVSEGSVPPERATGLPERCAGATRSTPPQSPESSPWSHESNCCNYRSIASLIPDMAGAGAQRAGAVGRSSQVSRLRILSGCRRESKTPCTRATFPST